MENKLSFLSSDLLRSFFTFFREGKFPPAYRFPRWCCCFCQRKGYFRPESSLLSNQDPSPALSSSERLQVSQPSVVIWAAIWHGIRCGTLQRKYLSFCCLSFPITDSHKNLSLKSERMKGIATFTPKFPIEEAFELSISVLYDISANVPWTSPGKVLYRNSCALCAAQ